MHNVGKIDRWIRLGIAAILIILYYTKIVEYQAVIIIALILAATSLRRCCPLYALLGLGTCGIETDKTDRVIDTKPLDLNKNQK
jgi:hypothetical protein